MSSRFVDNSIESYDDVAKDCVVVSRRLRKAAAQMKSALWSTTLVDVGILLLWLFILATPIVKNWHNISSEKISIITLCVACSLLPIAICTLRIVTVSRVKRRRLRVDQYNNAPTAIRQIAYMSKYKPLRTWFWYGYMASPSVAAVNTLLCVMWIIVCGLGVFFVSITLILLNALTAFLWIHSTLKFYDRGVRAVFSRVVAPGQAEYLQWARARTLEWRDMWDV